MRAFVCVVDESGGLAEREYTELRFGISDAPDEGTSAEYLHRGSLSASSDRTCRFCGQRYINQGFHYENVCTSPDPKPEKRVVDGTAEPLDRGPIDLDYCPLCQETKTKWQRCHVVGRGQGGDDVPENLFWACPDCHDALPPQGTDKVIAQRLVLYIRTLPETLEYIADAKYEGWLEDRYLGVQL